MTSLQYRMRSFRCVRLFAPLALSLLGGVAAPLLTPAPAQAQQQFGIVDFQSCAAQSKLKKDLDGQFDLYRRAMLTVFNRLKEGKAIFLTKSEMTELSGIYEKADKASAAETAPKVLEASSEPSGAAPSPSGGMENVSDMVD